MPCTIYLHFKRLHLLNRSLKQFHPVVSMHASTLAILLGLIAPKDASIHVTLVNCAVQCSPVVRVQLPPTQSGKRGMADGFAHHCVALVGKSFLQVAVQQPCVMEKVAVVHALMLIQPLCLHMIVPKSTAQWNLEFSPLLQDRKDCLSSRDQ